MSEHVELLIISPDAVIFEGAVQWVQLPLADGLLGVWPEHAPLIASLNPGTVELGTDSGISRLEIDGGTVRIVDDRCILLVGAPTDLDASSDQADQADRIDLFEQAEQALGQELEEVRQQEVGL